MNRAVCTTEDQKFCQKQLPHVSRTFALSIEALPEALREALNKTK